MRTTQRIEALRIVLYAPNDADAWTNALEQALPEARIESWSREAGSDADYAIVWRPSADVLPSLRSAKAIFNLGAGVDAIPELGVQTRAPLIRLDDAGMVEQMIEYVCHATLHCYRELDVYADQQRRAAWQPRPRAPKDEFVVGILGAGVLGAAVADSLARLRFPVRSWARTRKDLPGVTSFAGMAELAAFLSGTRFLVCLLPLTSETRHLLDRARLSLLPRGARVVNVARGPIVVEADLLALLDEGHLAGAILDVFSDEPLPPDHPFWHHPRVVVTPHVSAVTLIEASAEQIAQKIRRLEAGLPVAGVVDPVLGY
jgi:glyoxylate/hydroxypyruvate reductase A